MSEDKTPDSCGRCGALLFEGMWKNHRDWHVTIEPTLEKPTSEFGFWDFDGRWNQNSVQW